MKMIKNFKALVTKKFNEFYMVELIENPNLEANNKFLCTI